MKKLVFLAAIAALAVGCNEEPKQPVITGEEIGFRMVNGTKAFEEMNAANIKTISVFGEWVDAGVKQTTNQFDFAYDRVVKRAAGAVAWTYEPRLYWPANGDVNFYAYSPYGSVNVTNFAVDGGAGNKPIITYANPTNEASVAKHQEDFLVAATVGQNKTTPGTAAVQFRLYHALSQARFVARNSLKDVVFEIEEVRILNLKNGGNFDLSLVNYNSDPFRPQPTAWSNLTGTADHYALQNAGVAVRYRPETNVYNRLGDAITIIPQPVDSAAVVPAPGTNTTANTTLADAALTAAQGTGKTIVALKYRVYLAGDGTLNKNTTWVFFNVNLNKPTYNGSLNPAITANQFVMGARYTFVFNLNGDLANLIPISFDVAVTNWVDPTDWVILNN